MAGHFKAELKLAIGLDTPQLYRSKNTGDGSLNAALGCVGAELMVQKSGTVLVLRTP